MNINNKKEKLYTYKERISKYITILLFVYAILNQSFKNNSIQIKCYIVIFYCYREELSISYS